MSPDRMFISRKRLHSFSTACVTKTGNYFAVCNVVLIAWKSGKLRLLAAKASQIERDPDQAIPGQGFQGESKLAAQI
jgi:hypothetical protein